MATVTDKEIMREFASMAAAEAGLGAKNRKPSDLVAEGKSANGKRPGIASRGEGRDGTSTGSVAAVDEVRPTGYR